MFVVTIARRLFSVFSVCVVALAAGGSVSAFAANEVVIRREKPLQLTIPSIPENNASPDVVDKTLPVQLADIQLQQALDPGVTTQVRDVSPKVLHIGPSQKTAGLPDLSKLRERKQPLAPPVVYGRAYEAPVAVEAPTQNASVYTPPVAMEQPAVPPATFSVELPVEVASAPSAAMNHADTYTQPSPLTVANLPPLPELPAPIIISQVNAEPSPLLPSNDSVVAALPVETHTQTPSPSFSEIRTAAGMSPTPTPYVAPLAAAPSENATPTILAAAAPSIPFSEIAPAAGAATTSAPAPLPEPVSIPAEKEKPAAAPVSPTPELAATTTPTQPQAVVDSAFQVPTLKPSKPTEESAPKLSKESKKVLAQAPSKIDSPKKTKTESISIDRSKDASESLVGGSEVRSSHEVMGLKLEVRKPTLDVNYELEKAYAALAAGESAVAVELYKRALDAAPNNIQAKLGLAVAYHRAGQLDMARPLYAEVLQNDPNNRDALNNFLGLVGEEAPDEALVKLAQLMKRNPDFSAIPAQMATIYQKKGDLASAAQSMLQAVALSPENLPYKYNLAVLFDKQGRREEAATLYVQLINAAMRGENLPINIKAVQERLTFLRSNESKQ